MTSKYFVTILLYDMSLRTQTLAFILMRSEPQLRSCRCLQVELRCRCGTENVYTVQTIYAQTIQQQLPYC